MKAYKINAPHTIGLDEQTDALPVGGECVKLKNLLCGISATDIGVFSGDIPSEYPIIPGHSLVGFVSEAGDEVSGISRGNRVVTYPRASCKTCRACKDGRFYDCERSSAFGCEENGFLSDFSVVSSHDVYVIPDRLKDEEAIFTESTALAINVISRLGLEKGEHIIIVGAGAVGVILAQVAIYYQAVPIVVDMNEELLGIARAAGVYYTINSVSEDVCKKVLSLTGGHMADAAAYLPDSTMPLQNVFDYCCKRGRVAIVGSSGSSLKCTLNTLVEKSLELITVTDCGKNYPSAINMLANHTVSVEMLPVKTVPFAAVPEELEAATKDPQRAESLLVKI